MRKGEQASEVIVKDVNDQILRDGVEVKRRWAGYFEQVLNAADVREANIKVVGNNCINDVVQSKGMLYERC